MAKMTGKSPWLKSVLIPFWIFQLLFVAVMIGAAGYVARYSLVAAELLFLIICSVCIILDITEIILFAKRLLQPITYLAFQCCKTAMWLIIFFIVVVQTARDQQTPGDTVYTSALEPLLNGLIEAVVLLIAFIATLIYASVVYHRHRIAKKHRNATAALERERYDRFYHGPYGEDTIGLAPYREPQDPYSPSTMHNTMGSPTVFGGSPTSPAVKSGGYELPVGPLEKDAGEGEARGELDSQGAVYELGAARSVKSLKRR